jgi:serine protease Do
MKQNFLNAVVIAGLALAAAPALAQQGEGTKEKKDKSDKKEKTTQTIVITRTGDIDEKTVVEIKGEKVLVNGKEVSKSDDVKVNVHSFNSRLRPTVAQANGRNTWVFNGDQGSFFTEDSNRSMLGVITDENEKGAEVTSITKESAAEKAGIKKGDIITRIGDKKIEGADDVSEAVRSRKPGEKVAISVLRDGKEQKLTAELGRWQGMRMSTFTAPRIDMKEFESLVPSVRGTYNVPFAMSGFGSPRLGLSIQDTEDGKGVKVTEVEEESNAAKAGIKENDIITQINDKDVTSADEVSRAVRENKDKGPLRFQVTRDGKSQNIEVRFPKKLKSADL